MFDKQKIEMPEVVSDISVRRVSAALPIFLLNIDRYCVFYTPGRFAVTDSSDAAAIVRALNSEEGTCGEGVPLQVAQWLKEQAGSAVERLNEWLNATFEPQCLTLYLSNICNLGCSYCYAAGESDRKIRSINQNQSILREDTIHAAANLVAENCTRHSKAFSLVIHGGGEPTVHWALVERAAAIARQTARRFKIDRFCYIATNGVLSEKRAEWLARHFDLIGLSCDGPPDIQNAQRPLQNGEASSPFVERTAKVFREAGVPFETRSTITPQTMTRQEEIVRYLHDELGATTIRFEPAYRLKEKRLPAFEPHHADTFAEHFSHSAANGSFIRVRSFFFRRSAG